MLVWYLLVPGKLVLKDVAVMPVLVQGSLGLYSEVNDVFCNRTYFLQLRRQLNAIAVGYML